MTRPFTAIRERAGLSRAQLAKTIGIKEVKSIYRYEHGERPISGTIRKLMLMVDLGMEIPE